MNSVQQKLPSDLDDIFENIIPSIVYEHEGVITLVNKAFEKLLGYERQEVIGQHKVKLLEMILDQEVNSISDKLNHNYFIKKKNGDAFWATIKTNNFTRDDGTKASVWCIEDITAQRDAEQKLRQMSMAVDQSSNSVVITDTLGIIQYVNAKFVQITGYTADEAIGKNPSILQSGKTPVQLYEEMWHTINSGGEWHGQFINKKKNGEIYEEDVTVAPIRDEQGNITHFIATKENITELKKARQLAEKASKAKGEFLAYMSHEIRTPLNVIIGMTSLVLEKTLEPEQTKFLTRIKSSADNLLALVNDLLDYSKIEAGKLEINQYPFSLLELTNDIKDTVSFLAEKKGLALLVSTPPAMDFLLMGDRMRLYQVLYNLVGNAIKFTPQGKVELQVDMDRNETDTCLVTFQVKDTGIGIKPESLEKIFDSFVQAEAEITRNFGGTGLGLAISNQLVNLMGGTLDVKSVTGLGSHFSFSLLFPKAPDSPDVIEPTTEEISVQTKPKKVLLAEDNVGNQELATAILEGAGHHVVVAETGLEALEMLAENSTFDVVLMDVQMPDMDGLTATRCIRDIERGEETGVQACAPFDQKLAAKLSGGHLPIVAMTANAMLSDQEQCRMAGIDLFLAKPYTKEKLLAAIEGKATQLIEQQDESPLSKDQDDETDEASKNFYDDCCRFLMDNFTLDQTSAENVLNAFINSLQESLEQFDKALTADDRKNIQMLSHKVKGGLFNINCTQLGEIAKDIENTAYKNDLVEIEKLAGKIKEGLEPLFLGKSKKTAD